MSTLINLILIISILSIIFTRITNPLAIGLTLLIQTILICGATGISSKSIWFSYILFLIFLGAMLVLFIYVASLASNEQFIFSPTWAILTPVIIILPIILVSLIDPLIITQVVPIEISFISDTEVLQSTPFNVRIIYRITTINLTIFVILYLLLTLIVVVKITAFFYGPLRLS